MPVSSLPFTGKMALSRADVFLSWFPVVKSSWVGIQWFTEVDLGIVNQYISHHLCNTVTYNVNVLWNVLWRAFILYSYVKTV
jgi:hypothetical protein